MAYNIKNYKRTFMMEINKQINRISRRNKRLEFRVSDEEKALNIFGIFKIYAALKEMTIRNYPITKEIQ